MTDEQGARLAANFFGRFFYGEPSVLATGYRWLISGRVADYDLGRVRAALSGDFGIDGEGVSDDGSTWAMAVDCWWLYNWCDSRDGSEEEDDGYLRGSEVAERCLLDLMQRCYRSGDGRTDAEEGDATDGRT